MRTLRVGAKRYAWTSKGTDWGIRVAVATDEAFIPGQRGQWLIFSVPYEVCGAGGGPGGAAPRGGVVTPGLVRRAIDRAVLASPAFTGRPGEPNVTLDVAEVQAIGG